MITRSSASCALALALGVVSSVSATIVFTRKRDVQVWPPEKTSIAPNARIQLMIDATPEEVLDLLARHPAVLESSSDRVSLEVADVETPYGHGTCLILAPTRWMRGGAEYTLRFQGLTGHAARSISELDRWPAPGHAAPGWSTTKVPDSVAPIWKRAPKLMATKPPNPWSIIVPVETLVQDDQPGVHIRATVTPVQAGCDRVDDVQALHLGINGTWIDLGHSGQSGAFKLEPGARYRVALEAADLAGNRTAAPGEPLEIIWPKLPPEPPPKPLRLGVMVYPRR